TTSPAPVIPPSPTPLPKPGLKTVGYITHWQVPLLKYVKLEQLTHLIWQSVLVTSATDPTLQVADNYPWSQISEVIAIARPLGIKVLACLGGPWGDSTLNAVWESPALRARLVDNLKDLVVKYDLDGIDIDNEGHPTPELYSTFVAELYAALNPLGKIISMAGSPFSVNILPATAEYVDFISLMTYDMGRMPNYEHSTYEDSVQAMSLWSNTGISKKKLLMGIPFYARDAGTGFFYYRWIVELYDPGPEQNQAMEPLVTGGKIWWNGIDLVKKKVGYVIDSGYGGIMVYEITTDTFDARSLLQTIYDELQRVPPAAKTAGRTPIPELLPPPEA
ncbi:MAG: hypothetical protein HYX96_08590, partial [Chloroflexi bacterium]|nr:hypothetical protein [Chloroflexota bacterium]